MMSTLEVWCIVNGLLALRSMRTYHFHGRRKEIERSVRRTRIISRLVVLLLTTTSISEDHSKFPETIVGLLRVRLTSPNRQVRGVSGGPQMPRIEDRYHHVPEVTVLVLLVAGGHQENVDLSIGFCKDECCLKEIDWDGEY